MTARGLGLSCRLREGTARQEPYDNTLHLEHSRAVPSNSVLLSLCRVLYPEDACVPCVCACAFQAGCPGVSRARWRQQCCWRQGAPVCHHHSGALQLEAGYGGAGGWDVRDLACWEGVQRGG
jgi:hypothetical protein